MNTKTLSLYIVIFLFLSLDNSLADAEGKKIIIDEIQIGGTKASDEFIRLRNETETALDLTGFKLSKKSLSVGVCKETPLVSTGHFSGIVAPKNIFTIAHPSYKNEISADLEYSSSSYYLSNNTAVILYDATGNLVDKKVVGEDCTLISTPPDVPPVPPTPPAVPVVYTAHVRLNELLANPSGKEEETEFIELYNPSDTPIDLSLWSLRDASASGKYIFPEKTTLQAQGFLVIYRPTFKFALNNSNETVSLLDPNGEQRDTVSYKTVKEETSYNYTSTGWRGGTPTPGNPNQTNTLPETREEVPKKGYRGVALDFDAKGKDSDRDTLKYTWDFGDNHKSYKKKTTHTYEENGTYAVVLKTSDGKDDVEEIFTLKIESYPRREIRIISLLPNPAGNDSDKEWLLIENREKKTVNLKGYSIATGWKTMSNHPIREDFFIKSKKQATLTHDNALFTLPNQKGKIELRAPDGKVLQDIKYKLAQPVADNMVYRKEKGSDWKWDRSFIQKVAPSPKEEAITIIKEADTLMPNARENKPEEIIPSAEKNIPTTETRASSEEIETRSDQISLDPDRPLPQDILAYGTRVQVPDSITLTLSSEKKINPTPPSEASLLSGEESLLVKINASLNDFLNSAE